MPCTWADDRRDAMRVAAHLRIPFYTLDAQHEYKKGVIDYLLSEYKAGRTPNPDIMCNREVKFGAFFRFAEEHGADFIATGHYARVSHEGVSAQLMRGIDPTKDQSYFLWAIPQAALDKTLFPLGEKHKTDVRQLAKQYGIPVAEKKDSQGICFLGSISVDEFLRKEFHPEPGVAITVEGEETGQHDGAVLHTLGARVALSNAPAGPWYVIRKDMEKNVLTVSHEPTRDALTDSISLRESNWFEAPQDTVSVQYRYHGPTIEGTFKNDRFIPTTPITEPLASGQSLVIYRGDVCIGGGIIA